MSNVTALLLAGSVAVTVITARAIQQAGTESANGPRMSLAHGEGKAMDFTVTFTNTKREDVTPIPGMLVDCGGPPQKPLRPCSVPAFEHGEKQLSRSRRGAPIQPTNSPLHNIPHAHP